MHYSGDGGMRKETSRSDQENMIAVYGDKGSRKLRMEY